MEKIVYGRYYSPESRQKNTKLNFKAAQVNILASADQHGHLENMHDFDLTIHDNFDKIFPESNKKWVANVFAIVGDWFIEPGADDYKTLNYPSDLGKHEDGNKPRAFTVGDYQLLFLNKIVDKIDERFKKIWECHDFKPDEIFKRLPDSRDIDFKIAKKDRNISKASGEVTNARYTTLLGIGNHCMDSGDEHLLNLLKGANEHITPLLTNANFENKKAGLLKNNKNVKEYTILEVEDDNNPDLKHKVLFLSMTPNRLGFYCHGMAKNLNVLDYVKGLRMYPTGKWTLKDTFKKTFTLIEAFKKNNPNGAVVLLNHVGNPLSAEFVKRIETYRNNLDSPDKNDVKIDLILNGHDHKDFYKALDSNGNDLLSTYKDGNIPGDKEYVPVISLGTDNKFFRGVKLKFDDNGKSKVIYDPDNDHFQCDSKGKPLYGENLCDLFKNVLRDDIKKNIQITIGKTDEEREKYKHITELGYEQARWNYAPVANVITDGILDSIRVRYPEITLLGVASGTVRARLPVNDNKTSRYNLFNLLCGNTPDGHSFYRVKGGMSGLELVKLVAEYIAYDMKNPGRNSIIQWAGLRINRDGLWKITDQNYDKYNIADTITKDMAKYYLPYIRIKNIETGKYEKIDLDENRRYNIALQKHLVSLFPILKGYERQGIFIPMFGPDDEKWKINPKARDLFYDYLERNNFDVTVPNPDDDVRVKTSKQIPVELVKKH